MIDSFINAVVTVMGWIISGIAAVAGLFGSIANSAKSIPGVGSTLQALFVSVQAFFNDIGFNFAHFSTRVKNVLDAIDNWLDQLVDLINDVGGWISDKLDAAYAWARNAIDWINDEGADLFNDLYGWIMDRLDLAYTRARNALNWINDAGLDLFNDVYGWIMDKLDDAYSWAYNAWDWIQDFPSHVVEFLQPLRDEILQTLAPAFNLISFFFEDINDFFSDPAEYFAKRLERLGVPFAERFWDFVEKILERIW